MKLATLILSAGLLAAPAFAGQCNTAKAQTAAYTGGEAQVHLAGYNKDAKKAEKKDIVETAAEAGSFTTLLAAAEAAGLVEALQGEGPLTVFAPTDAAFAALPDGTVETLLKPENKDQLAGILKLHVIAGKVKSKDLAGTVTTAETLNGSLSVDGTDGVTVTAPGSTATVVSADIYTSNGVIHVIDTVLLPAG